MQKIPRKAKFLHIIWHPDLKFIPSFVEIINESGYFNPREHIFVTPHKRVYDQVSKKYEIYLAGTENENLINRFGEYGDWIIAHSLNCSNRQILFTKNKYARKVIWRTWGHDIRPYVYDSNKPLRSVVRKVLFPLYLKKIHQFKLIGIANDIDKVNIVNSLGNTPTYVLPYVSIEFPNGKKTVRRQKDKSETKRILVGHSGSPLDCHIDGLKKLVPYRNENIKICLILSYGGSKEYCDSVKKFAIENFEKKIEVVETFMDKAQYLQYLSEIDIAIFPQKYSSALGNLAMLMYFDIPVFVKDNSQFANSFKHYRYDYCSLDNVGIIPFEEFISKRNPEDMNRRYGKPTDKKTTALEWKNFIDYLENGNE